MLIKNSCLDFKFNLRVTYVGEKGSLGLGVLPPWRMCSMYCMFSRVCISGTRTCEVLMNGLAQQDAGEHNQTIVQVLPLWFCHICDQQSKSDRPEPLLSSAGDAVRHKDITTLGFLTNQQIYYFLFNNHQNLISQPLARDWRGDGKIQYSHKTLRVTQSSATQH